ncbi:MAG: hypothetical protein HQ472_07980 [Ignavibacteria bacterium]|nr:hypothetical protein [Ignavibacteria bacterium]
MTKPIFLILSVVIAVFIVFGCSTTEYLSGSWANLAYKEKPLTKIVILATGPGTAGLQDELERVVAKEMKGNGVDATAASEVFGKLKNVWGSDGALDVKLVGDQMLEKLIANHVNGVMVVTVKSAGDEGHHVQEPEMYQPRTFYNGWLKF